MKTYKISNYFFTLRGAVFFIAFSWLSLSALEAAAQNNGSKNPADSTGNGNDSLKYPLRDRKPWETGTAPRQFDLKTPDVIKTDYKLDRSGTNYDMQRSIGNTPYGMPSRVSMQEKMRQDAAQANQKYFRERSNANNFVTGGGLIPKLYVGPKVFDKIFGGGVVDIRPSGAVELTFGGNFNTVRNPMLNPKQQKQKQFDFKQKIQLNVTGNIGEKLKLGMNYDTEATFEFENQIKLDYTGKEDEIIKKIELGNVSLPLNSSLITAGQSLFGVKAQLQFGRLTMTSIATQQKGKITETEIKGGAQVTPFDIPCDRYDLNRHFFLAHYFRDNFNNWMGRLPLVTSPVVINRVEVWVTNRNGNPQDTRDVLALMDLAEPDPYNNGITASPVNNGPFAANPANNLYQNIAGDPQVRNSYEALQRLQANYNYLTPSTEYQLVNYARQLSSNEFTFHPNLGYISLNQPLNNDEVLGVAFEYSVNGVLYQVGEFSRDVPPDSTQQPKLLFLKMLKSVSPTPNLPIFDLMMKNIYSLDAYQVQAKDFKLNVIYADDPSGADLNYIPVQSEPLLSGIPLLTVLNLDNVNQQKEPVPDGVFDFLEGVTILPQNGRIIFPILEPFGAHLRSKFTRDPVLANRYAYDALYDSTVFQARQQAQLNKFFIRGSYQGAASNVVKLNSLNVPKGSVKVTANGTPLTENVDYIVDYTLGEVKIINSGLLSSGATIKVTAENNTLYSIQSKTLVGSRFDYKINNNFLLGGTILHLQERPLTPKINIGDEPLKNTIIGFDGSYTTESRFLTKMVDRLPFIETKEPSSISLAGEYAQIIPGNPQTLGDRGTAYIDDFEGSETPYDLKQWNQWRIASTPQGQPDIFPEATQGNVLGVNFKRARLAWYTLDASFYRDNVNTPDNTKLLAYQSNHYIREVTQNEVYQNKQLPQGQPGTLPTLDLAYFPKNRGQYNYNIDNLAANGTLENPSENWGGIMRRIETSDFELANIEYMEIWMMDPFTYQADPNVNNGELYINLGSVSEDVCKDGRKSFENGLPKAGGSFNTVDTTIWGIVPQVPTINNAFSNEPADRPVQDVGYDGLSNEQERTLFNDVYLNAVRQKHGASSVAAAEAEKDPSGDDFLHYFDPLYDNGDSSFAASRYKYYNGLEGNSTLNTITTSKVRNFPASATTIPDDEDINRDFTLNQSEDYYQYRINLDKRSMVVGQNFITDSVVYPVKLKDGRTENIVWYQFKVPIRDYQRRIGSIGDFKGIRFIRMYVRGFEDSVILRFAAVNLIRADWRKYLYSLEKPGEYVVTDPNDNTNFVVSTVNIEKNGKRIPIPYTEPPGIPREIDPSQPNVTQQNEQSISLLACNLKDGDARAVFKQIKMDMRNYKKLEMFVHAEGQNLKDQEMTAFIRVGTDFNSNYYEYEIPLKVTQPGSKDQSSIWPIENQIALELDSLYYVKQKRDNDKWGLVLPYSLPYKNGKITVLGLPDLSTARVLLIGIRNPKKTDQTPGDDGLPKCGEIWMNEMRLTEFNTKGGWAANARIVTKLADLGVVTASGNYRTIGFGGLDKKLNERSLTNDLQYEVSSTWELGKFFGARTGVTIPFFISYGQTIIRPKYNPLNPDILLETALRAADDAERERIRNAAEDYTSNYAYNFTNVKKNRVGNKKAHVWDIENFNGSYAYTRTQKRNSVYEFNNTRRYTAGLGYSYSFNSKNYKPFSKIGSAKWLTPIREFNFYLLPQSFSVVMNTERYYNELKNRNNDNPLTLVPTLFDKNFTLNRTYDLRHNFSQSLTGSFNAKVNARVDEPNGSINTEEKRDTIRNNFYKLGRITNYTHSVNLNYNLPFSKIPILNWVSAPVSYTAGYEWKTKLIAAPEQENTISNSQQINVSPSFNMVTLYNKIPYFRKVNQAPGAPKANNKPSKKKKPGTFPENKPKPAEKEEEKQEEEKPSGFSKFLAGTAKTIMMVKNVSFTYGLNRGLVVPGFIPKPKYIGLDPGSGLAPGYDFVFGSQEDPREDFVRNGWLTRDSLQLKQFTQAYGVNLTGRATIEPFKDFRIDVNWQRTFNENYSTNYRYSDVTDQFENYAPALTGNFNMTYNIWRTAFEPKGANYASQTFTDFENARFNIAKRLQNENPASRGLGNDTLGGYPVGYGRNQQDVVILAFLAAYSGKNSATSGLELFPKIPAPNWRINYSGFNKFEWFKNWASSMTISHGYQSNYSVGSYQSNLGFNPDSIAVNGRNITSQYNILQVSLIERFTPLLGIDLTLINGLTIRVEYKTDRSMNLSVANYTMSESRNKDFTIGAGYRAKDLTLPIKVGGRKFYLPNDINFRLDFSIKNTLTIVRKLDEPVTEPTSGSRLITIRPSIDYMVNDKLNIRLFYDRRMTKPAISTSFPTAITQMGVTLRYSIAP